MKRIFFLKFFVFFLLFFSACDHNSLNVNPVNEISEDFVWNDPKMVDSYLNDIYSAVGHGHQTVTISSGVDETIITHGWDDTVLKQSTLTPDNLGFWRNRSQMSHYRWGNLYSNIRKVNNLLDNVDNLEASDTYKDRIKGEAYFLRGYFYHHLVRLWGGVPNITTVFTLDNEIDDYLVSRDTFEETINLIVSDLETAAILLPVEQVNKGRATKGAAKAIKSRILLFAASDLYHINPSNMPETGYLTGDQQAFWRAAKNAAQDVMDMGVYDLHEDYRELFLIVDNDEAIFSRYFQSGIFEHRANQAHAPNGFLGYSGDTPLRQHVDAYELEDGSKFDWDNPMHAATPFENRDPRFYASILYHGAYYRERPPGVHAPPTVQSGWYEIEGSDELNPGVDTRDSHIGDWNGTFTGFHMKKFLDPTTDAECRCQTHPWIFIRYSEILLNFAEASIELGEYEDARMAMNLIRQRAGMPDIPATETGQELLERLRNERRVELAFEDFRYFDVRRWMIAPEAYSENGGGVQVIGRLNEDGSYTYEYNLRDIDIRGWNDRAYFLPIERDEINSNQNLVQNPGYN